MLTFLSICHKRKTTYILYNFKMSRNVLQWFLKFLNHSILFGNQNIYSRDQNLETSKWSACISQYIANFADNVCNQRLLVLRTEKCTPYTPTFLTYSSLKHSYFNRLYSKDIPYFAFSRLFNHYVACDQII